MHKQVCKVCSEPRLLDEFGMVRNNQGRRYRRLVCKPCRAAITRARRPTLTNDALERERLRARRWRAANADRVRELTRKHHRLNLDQRRAENALRRASIAGAAVESVDHRVVFERDDYRCQICGIETSGRWPALTSASLDHIVPLSKGGAHSYANTQCACLSCNTRKGARV